MTASSKTCQPVALLRYARSRQACIISVQVQMRPTAPTPKSNRYDLHPLPAPDAVRIERVTVYCTVQYCAAHGTKSACVTGNFDHICIYNIFF